MALPPVNTLTVASDSSLYLINSYILPQLDSYHQPGPLTFSPLEHRRPTSSALHESADCFDLRTVGKARFSEHTWSRASAATSHGPFFQKSKSAKNNFDVDFIKESARFLKSK